MGCPSVSADDKKWKIENDARTLADAQEIRADAKRYAAACKELKDKAKNTQLAVKVEAGLKAAFKGSDS